MSDPMDDATMAPPPSAGETPPPRGRGRFLLDVILVRARFLMLFVVVGLVAGQWDRIEAHWERWQRPDRATGAEASAVEFYCPMHPSIVRDDPGSCPLCGMPLSRRKKGEREDLPDGVLARVQLSPWRIAQAGVRTVEVAPRPLVREVEAAGFVEVDERRERRLAARFPGRVDGISVDFTGAVVEEGEPLLRLYSPEVRAAEEALLAAARGLEAAERAGAPAPDLERARRLLDSARDRLLLWGLAPDQVEAVLAAGRPGDAVEVRSPLRGTVLEKRAVLGRYVMEGEDLYRVADLSRVWVRARLFADEIALARVGTPVEAAAEGLPGETFAGTVAFVDPVLDPATRTVGVRVDLDNAGGRLRPGMFVTARLRIPVADLEPFRTLASTAPPAPARAPGAPASYRTCPEHPEVVAAAPGACPRCSADLEERPLGEDARLQWWCPMHPSVTADRAGEECAACGGMRLLPRVVREIPAGSVLAVPELAVVDTGRRSVVYRESSPGVFDAVEVVLGPRTGGWYPVVSGVAAGERVVGAGAFLVDAETRLNPSAAAAYFGASGSPSGGGGHSHGK